MQVKKKTNQNKTHTHHKSHFLGSRKKTANNPWSWTWLFTARQNRDLQ